MRFSNALLALVLPSFIAAWSIEYKNERIDRSDRVREDRSCTQLPRRNEGRDGKVTWTQDRGERDCTLALYEKSGCQTKRGKEVYLDREVFRQDVGFDIDSYSVRCGKF